MSQIERFGFCVTEDHPFNTVRYTAVREKRAKDAKQDTWKVSTQVTEGGQYVDVTTPWPPVRKAGETVMINGVEHPVVKVGERLDGGRTVEITHTLATTVEATDFEAMRVIRTEIEARHRKRGRQS